MVAGNIMESGSRLLALKEILNKLPIPNYENLRFIIKFFAVLTNNLHTNEMTAHNIATIIAANLIWSPKELILNDQFL